MTNPYQKIIHRAKFISPDGAVSPLCAKKPKAINLKVTTWTNRANAVTCEKCKEIQASERKSKMTKKIPASTRQYDLNIMGFVLKCHVLNNGERIIEADSIAEFFQHLENGEVRLSKEDALSLAKFVKGVD